MDLGSLQPGVVTRTPFHAPRSPDGHVDLLAFARAGAPLLFESARAAPGAGHHSYVVVGTAGRLVHDGHTTTLTTPDGAALDLGPDAFAAIDLVTEALAATPDDTPPPGGPPFVGGLAGAWAYDLGRLVEVVPEHAAADREPTWMDLLVVTDMVVVDHRDEQAWRVRRPVAGAPPSPTDADLHAWLSAAPATPGPARPRSDVALTTSLPEPAYREALGRIADLLAAGDVFQVNLAQRLTCSWPGDGVGLYGRLRGASPAPHGALFLRGGGRAIASISPETFLQATGREVVTRPIKGTRSRGDDAATDAAARDDLAASAKDRAENVMVVDMERNDLGRVCRPGSVRTTELLRTEAHPTVWQLVSTVGGTLREEVGWGGLLAATFPSGSITGTPKVRAMQVIEVLEPVRRSWYCGSLGWLGPGSASLSVAIRTAILYDGHLDYAAGGGIVADSRPDDEIAESWAKAAAFLRAVGASPPGDDPVPPGAPRLRTHRPDTNRRRTLP